MTGTAAPANVLGRAANSHAFIEFVLTVSIHFILKMCKDKQLILYLYSSFKRKRHEETCSLFVACRSVFTSCATASLSKYRGVGRIKQYDFYSYDVPSAFDGFRIGFASDFHYESRFTRKLLTMRYVHYNL